MVYLLVELFNYKQLTRLRTESLPIVEQRLAEMFGRRKIRPLKMREGIALVECGREGEFDAGACASLSLQVLEYLKSARDELFGFTMLIASMGETEAAEVEETMKDLASASITDEELWIDEAVIPLFGESLSVDPGGGIRRVAAARSAEPNVEETGTGRTGWIRENLVKKALEALAPRLDGGEEGRVLFLYGPAGTGKTALLREAARRLGAGDQKAPLLSMYTIFRRRSPFHPLINSLSPALIAEVPKSLHGPELPVWKEVGRLLEYLRGTEESSEVRPEAFFPDHLQEDFTIGYQLYLLAFIRMTASQLLPAILACEGVETYHPLARRIIARIMGNLLPNPNFLPVISSTVRDVPEDFSGLPLVPLHVHPLGKREIRSLSRSLFPGLEIPHEEARRLKRFAGGQFVPVVSSLQFLLKTGRIRAVNGSFEWVQAEGEGDELPANPLAVSWHLIKSLPENSFLLLYSLYLSAGLLDHGGLLEFLTTAGFEEAAVQRALDELVSFGLIADEELLAPRIPALRRKLEEFLGEKGEKMREDFISFVVSLWKKGKYPRRVLIFSFLAKAGKTDLALEVLPHIIRRKLDERDLAGARIFCEPERLDFSASLDAAQKEELSLIAASGKLRASLLESKLEEAAEHHKEMIRLQKGGMRGETAGDAQLLRVAHSLAHGRGAAALDELKSALIAFQENGFERGERAAYHLLGLTMLGEGKTGEAIEYFGLSERLCGESGDQLGVLRSSAFLAVCYFLECRITRCLQKAEAAEEAALSACQREQELFLRFLRARCFFQLGLYEQCALHLQTCLCNATLYYALAARPVLSAWLGRSMLYQGDVTCAMRYLERLDPSRETLYFLAEGALFSENFENASLFAERGIAAATPHLFPPPEGVSWRDGFSSIEGRCFPLGRDDAFLLRGIRALTGFSLGLRGYTKDAVRELHRLTRGEDSADKDPHAYLYAYLYSLILPEYATEEGDDKTTILSKSLKGLQERASRIEFPAHKIAFMGSNYWNKRIMQDSKKRKLL